MTRAEQWRVELDGAACFFDLDDRKAAFSAAGDPLEKMGGLIDIEIFRPAFDAALQPDGNTGGRPPLDAVMMFKTLIL